MLVAIPTAIPSEPFIRKFGIFTGRTDGSLSVSSKLEESNTKCGSTFISVNPIPSKNIGSDSSISSGELKASLAILIAPAL